MIIDHFMFFNEVELLELRVNMLKDYVDKFIISESSRTHSGKPKEFICKKLISELGLPVEKIEVLEVEIPEEEFLVPNTYDIHHAQQAESSHAVLTWTRERLQRDALYGKVEGYPDDTVFILSDLDEIVNPIAIPFLANFAKKGDYPIKVPLVLLEGEADKRLCYADGAPVPWERSLLFCKKEHMTKATFTEIRGQFFMPCVWMQQDGKMMQDLGWHFTWMGGSERKKIKASSYLHHANLNVINNISHETSKEIGSSIQEYMLKDYSLSDLPKEIFESTRVFKFLLPNLTIEEAKALRG